MISTEVQMKKTRKILAVLMALVLTAAIFAGCGGAASSAASSEASSGAASQQTESGAASPSEAASGEAASMAASSQSSAPEAESATREITDMAGRTITLPAAAEIGKVFSCDPTAAIYLYTLVPDQMLGWNYELNEIERSVILEKYHTLPNFGMGDAISYEAVIAAGPGVALRLGANDDASRDTAAAVEESIGVPVVPVSSDLQDAPAVYRMLGEVFGVQAQAEELAKYAEDTFNDITNTVIPEEEKVRVYYGNGADSLETAPPGSSSSAIIDMVNAVNAADLELGDGSRVGISAEQLLAWNPDFIMVIGEAKQTLSGGAAAQAIMDDPKYATLKAVQNETVFGVPNAPFSWVDRPPGPNRIVGMRWLAKKLYPDRFSYDLDEEVREYFKLFYHLELTDEKLAEVYSGYAG
jgi:iron complex transport system substrate-binding protein